MAMLPFEDSEYYFNTIEAAWETKEKLPFDVYRARTDFYFVKNVWDSYKMPEGMKLEETLIGVLKERFSNIEACRVCRPLGDFKDFYKASHQDVYEALCASFMLPRTPQGGGWSVSYIDVLYSHVKDLSARYNKYGDKHFDRVSFERGLSIMLWRSAIGIFLESVVNDMLAARGELNENFGWSAAPADWESLDVDGYFYRKFDGEPVVKASIKTLNALTERSIANWRKPVKQGGKGKTVPDIYIGIKDKDNLKLDVILVNGKSLKVLLAEALEELNVLRGDVELAA